jgi:hypothetical protein
MLKGFQVAGKIGPVDTTGIGNATRILPFLKMRFESGRRTNVRGIAFVKRNLTAGTVRPKFVGMKPQNRARQGKLKRCLD